jgi:hypothetical protein
MMGPVQVLVVGFEHPTFSGEVLAELTRLGDAGIIRLIDLLVVQRGDDGTIETVDPPPELDARLGHVAATLLGQREDDGDRDTPAAGDASTWSPAGDGTTWSLADAVPVGAAAAVALIEHVWAAPLRAAILRAGGTGLEETWLAPDDVATVEALLAKQS